MVTKETETKTKEESLKLKGERKQSANGDAR